MVGWIIWGIVWVLWAFLTIECLRAEDWEPRLGGKALAVFLVLSFLVIPSVVWYNDKIGIPEQYLMYQDTIRQTKELLGERDLNLAEMGELIRLAQLCEVKIRQGEIENVEDYEAIPFKEQMLDRLKTSMDYLNGLIQELSLS